MLRRTLILCFSFVGLRWGLAPPASAAPDSTAAAPDTAVFNPFEPWSKPAPAQTSAPPAQPARPPDNLPNTPALFPAHAFVLSRYLSLHPELRLLSIADAGMDETERRNVVSLTKAMGNVHPYYVIADLNHDGRMDFAVLLYDATNREFPGAVAIFNGPFDPGRLHDPVLVDRGYKLHGWCIWLDREAGPRLGEGVANSKDYGWYIWKHGKYQHEFASLGQE
jgi:hypothetical protein